MNEKLPVLRQLSLCTVMESIVHCAPISRASIAKQTGLSKQTVSEVARRLEADGWIRETGRTKGHVGRTAVTYEIVANAACIISVDLGGTKVRVAIADLACHILAELTEATDARGGLQVVEQIARMSREAATLHQIDFAQVMLAVVGVPGVVHSDSGRVLMAPNILGLADFDVEGALRTAIGDDVILENDVNLAVIGEHWIGNGSTTDDLAYIALGTGIGAGMMVAGKLVSGASSMAGELGYLPFGADPYADESLRVGALERVVATVGMQSKYLALSGEVLDVPGIFDAAAAGDKYAEQVLDESARFLARAVATICCVTNPGKVIFGGSIGCRVELLERVRVLLAQCFPYPVPLEISALGPLAAITGGAAIGLSQLHTQLFSGGVPGAQISLPASGVLSLVKGGKS